MEILKFIDFEVQSVCEIGVFSPQYAQANFFIERNINTILVEANPKCINNIKEFYSNFKNVKIFNKAVCDKNEKVFLYNRGDSPDASAFISDIQKPPSIINDKYQKSKNDIIECEGVTFDLIDPGNIDILFLDMEGAEWYAIKHMKSKPKIISVEMIGAAYNNPFKIEIEEWMKNNNYYQCGLSGCDFFFKKDKI